MTSRLAGLLGRWHWMALGLMLGLLAGFYYLSKAPKIYQACATLLVKRQNAPMFSPNRAEETKAMALSGLEALNTVADRITRPELLKKIASRPDVRFLPALMPRPVEWLPEWLLPWVGKSAPGPTRRQPPPPPAALAAAISSWTRISVRRGTRLLDVTVSHPSPATAMALANAVGMEYQAELTGARSNGRDASLQILVEESETARNRLQNAQNALAGYQHALSTLKELEAKEATVNGLAQRYRHKHPRVIAAHGDLTAHQQRFLAEFEAARNSPADRDYWENLTAEWQNAGDDPAAQLVTARRLLLTRGTVLESEITSQTSVFSSILTRIQKDSINRLADEAEMEISSLARLPATPVSPVAAKALGISSSAGLGFGLLLALIFTRLNDRIHTVAQAEAATGIETIASVAALKPRILQNARRRQADPESIPAARRAWDPLLLRRDDPDADTFAELVRLLKPPVSLPDGQYHRRLTLFSSALPGEGKTFVSGNFALTAARQGKSTLLIDLDLRKPAVHSLFGLQRDSHPYGAAEVLANQASFDQAIFTETGKENLHLILAGRQSPNPGELLNSGSLAELLATACQRYRLVVIDSAPLLAVPDTRIIAPLVHHFCLVVRANYASTGAVHHAIHQLRNDHHLPGYIILNALATQR